MTDLLEVAQKHDVPHQLLMQVILARGPIRTSKIVDVFEHICEGCVEGGVVVPEECTNEKLCKTLIETINPVLSPLKLTLRISTDHALADEKYLTMYSTSAFVDGKKLLFTDDENRLFQKWFRMMICETGETRGELNATDCLNACVDEGIRAVQAQKFLNKLVKDDILQKLHAFDSYIYSSRAIMELEPRLRAPEYNVPSCNLCNDLIIAYRFAKHCDVCEALMHNACLRKMILLSDREVICPGFLDFENRNRCTSRYSKDKTLTELVFDIPLPDVINDPHEIVGQQGGSFEGDEEENEDNVMEENGVGGNINGVLMNNGEEEGVASDSAENENLHAQEYEYEEESDHKIDEEEDNKSQSIDFESEKDEEEGEDVQLEENEEENVVVHTEDMTQYVADHSEQQELEDDAQDNNQSEQQIEPEDNPISDEQKAIKKRDKRLRNWRRGSSESSSSSSNDSNADREFRCRVRILQASDDEEETGGLGLYGRYRETQAELVHQNNADNSANGTENQQNDAEMQENFENDVLPSTDDNNILPQEATGENFDANNVSVVEEVNQISEDIPLEEEQDKEENQALYANSTSGVMNNEINDTITGYVHSTNTLESSTNNEVHEKRRRGRPKKKVTDDVSFDSTEAGTSQIENQQQEPQNLPKKRGRKKKPSTNDSEQPLVRDRRTRRIPTRLNDYITSINRHDGHQIVQNSNIQPNNEQYNNAYYTVPIQPQYVNQNMMNVNYQQPQNISHNIVHYHEPVNSYQAPLFEMGGYSYDPSTYVPQQYQQQYDSQVTNTQMVNGSHSEENAYDYLIREMEQEERGPGQQRANVYRMQEFEPEWPEDENDEEINQENNYNPNNGDQHGININLTNFHLNENNFQ